MNTDDDDNTTDDESVKTARDEIIEQIESTLSHLQLNALEQEKVETNLRMSLRKQETQIKDLEKCLQKEKLRNNRLASLMTGVDSDSSSQGDMSSRGSAGYFDTVSPVMMQYRYDELLISHKKCLKQLSKKDKLLRSHIYEKDELQQKYNELFESYTLLHKRLERVCSKYLKLRASKTEEIIHIRQILNASISRNEQ